MPIAVSRSYEKRLAKVHRCLSVVLFQRDRNHCLNVGRKTGVLIPLEGVDQPLWFNHFKVFTALPQVKHPQDSIANIESIGMQAKPPLSSRPTIVFNIPGLKLPWPAPMLDMLRIGHHLPDQLPRRIELARDAKFMLRRRRRRHRCCTHRTPPFVLVVKRPAKCSANLASVCSPPSIEWYS